MKQFCCIFAAAAALYAADSPALNHARQELEHVRKLVDSGLLAPAKLGEAQAALDDANDEAVLDRTLYGRVQIDDLSEGETAGMVAAAQRRLNRVQDRVARWRQLIADGSASQGDVAELDAEAARRHQALDLATTRASLFMEIVQNARAEASEAEEGRDTAPPGVWKARERVDGDHPFEPKDIKALTLAFEKKFDKPMPISARGSTAVHRALGFDHTGRIDVAVNPDAPEGVWLRKYLDAKEIPYYAFRMAIPGKATGAHIHIGPGSTRLPVSD